MHLASPQVSPKKEAELRAAFWDQVATFPDGFKIRNCIQCGSCTGSCPVAHVMDITPRQIVALFRAGFLEDILRSRSIWICASCYACTVRCPRGHPGHRQPLRPQAGGRHAGDLPEEFPAHALSKAFVDNIHARGRNWELWLGIRVLPHDAARPSCFSANLQTFGLGC